MPQAGNEPLALWREAGEWWDGSTGREVRRLIDAQGVRREVVTDLPAVEAASASQVRIRPMRDEKVRQAAGTVAPTSYGVPRRGSKAVALLHCLSGCAFGRGTMMVGELPAFAACKGYRAALVADPYSLVGAREFCRTAHVVGVRPLVGACFEMAEGGWLVLVARNAVGYRSLSRLVTACHLEEPRHYPLCNWDRLERHREGLLCLTGGSEGVLDLRLARRDYQGASQILDRLIGLYGQADTFVEVERSYLPWQIQVERFLLQLAQDRGVLPVAGGPVLYEDPSHFPVHDVLTCIESLCLVDEVEGRKPRRHESQPADTLFPRRSLNRERHMRPVEQLCELFSDCPSLIDNTRAVVQRCEKDVLPGRADLPRFCDDEDRELRQIVEAGAKARFAQVTRQHQKRIDYELARLTKLGWSRHFLIAWEMCEWAKSQQILLSGRGSVVDSVVAYCLGISRIDAFAFNLHFDRFLPADGSKRPDIDIDFEAARREDVRQHLVQRYGEANVATVAAIGTYRTRGIIREVGKVMGIPEQSISFLAKRLHGSVNPRKLETALEERPELRDSKVPRERYYWVFKLAEQMMDLPRNLRAHSSGVVISADPIADTVPVELSGADGVKIIQWDKRSAKYSFDKFDILCLRGNDVLGGTARRVEGLNVTSLPLDDPEVFRAMQAGQLIGIPQSASPAMRQAHVRIKTQNLKDAGIVQAGIRPGVGGAVKLNEYIARRNGRKFSYAHPDLAEILDATLGIVVFQEQIDLLLHKFGGFDGGEAEEVREAIQRYQESDKHEALKQRVEDRIRAHGYSQEVSQEVCKLVAGFKGYGFAEGHALSFAEVSIRSIYCQQNYPAPYFAALLDAQPAGYYGPATIVNEARVRGVKILPPDVNLSGAGFSVEDYKSADDPKLMVPSGAIRVPLRQISGLSHDLCEATLANRPYRSMFDFAARVAPNRDELEALVLAGAFGNLHPNRRAALWSVSQAVAYGESARKVLHPQLVRLDEPSLPENVDDFDEGERAIHERRLLRLDVERHLMAFERARVRERGGLTAAEASVRTTSDRMFVVGNPIRLRFPPTESGKRVMFFDLEDETGLLNVTCFDDVYQRDGHKVICHPYVTLWGEAQNRDGHIAFLAHRIYEYRPTMSDIGPELLPIVTGDFMMK